MDDQYTRGWPQIRHNLLQDLAALNKTEMLLWDVWGPDEKNPELFDKVAAQTQRDDEAFPGLQETYETRPGLKAPPMVKSYSPAHGPREVRLMP